MQNFTISSPKKQIHRLLSTTALLALAGSGLNASEADGNHIELYFGGAYVDGNKATFNARSGLDKDGFGGIESMRVAATLAGDWEFVFAGKALYAIDDYAAHLSFKKEDTATIRFGYESTSHPSVAYGVGFPPDKWVFPFDPELSLDRSRVYVEFQLHRPDAPVYTLRYTRHQRDGQKASTIYGDSTLGIPQRNIVPSYYDLDETRDILELRVEKEGDSLSWSAGAVYEERNHDNSVVALRRPGEGPQRYQVQNEGADHEMWSVNGAVRTRVSDQLSLMSSANWTTFKGKITGDRIYGATTDAVFDPVFPNRQARDSGILDLLSTSDLRQFVGTVGAVYQPAENWTIVPSVRFERMYQDVDNAFQSTSVGTGAGLPMSFSNQTLESNKDFNSITSRIDLRYTGIRRMTFSGAVLYGYGDGSMEEENFRVSGPSPTLLLERETDYIQERILIRGGAHWQMRSNLRLSLGAYHKFNRNKFDHIRDAAGITGGDRFPGYIRLQDFRVNDINVRAMWRISSNLTSITRLDYQLAKVFSRAGDFSIRSAHTERQIISQSISWSPVQRLALQVGLNLVEDAMRTPPNESADLLSAGIVLRDRHNYKSFNLTAFYAINAMTDLTVVYNGYFSNNSYDNANVGLPLGNRTEENTILTTLTRRITDNLTLTLNYGLYSYREGLSLFKEDYTAHVVSSRVLYRF